MATVKKHEPRVDMRRSTFHFAKLMADRDWEQKLFRLVLKSVGGRVDTRRVKGILHGNGTDGEKINKIMAMAKPTPGDEAKRASGRAAQIGTMVKFKPARYVDFGCGDRTITEAVGQYFGLAKENIIGVDLFDSGRQGSRFEKDLDAVAPGADLMTCFVSLHHTDVAEQIKKISRVVADDGVVVIREHDAPQGDILFYHYLQAVHVIAAVWDTAGDLNEILDSANYHSMNQWVTYFDRAGFGHYKILQWSPEGNPQRLFYAAFSKQPLDPSRVA
jgi:hypothetical protein